VILNPAQRTSSTDSGAAKARRFPAVMGKRGIIDWQAHLYSPDEAGAARQYSATSLTAIASAIFMQEAQSCRSEFSMS
jgi:hypothetical protein